VRKQESLGWDRVAGDKGKEKRIREKRKIIGKKKKEKGSIHISPSYPRYTATRSCFAKRFPKTASAPSRNPLHQHSHSWS
jgi:hypothetical protein